MLNQKLGLWILFSTIISIFTLCDNNVERKRVTLSLNGKWKIAQSKESIPPFSFSASIPVPGLLDLAQPKFDSSGYECSQRNYFWYKKEFELGLNQKPDFAYLKVHKAKFGHAVFINGNKVGEYNFCFTPSYSEIGQYLNYNGKNEILIRVGAHPHMLPDTIPYGYDVEKSLYYPGIYDRVELFLGDFPYIENVQVVPDIKKNKIKSIIWLKTGNFDADFNLRYTISESQRGKIVNRGEEYISAGEFRKLKIEIDGNIPDAQLWSPDHPFLYNLKITSPGDSKIVTFGMREFRVVEGEKVGFLNGKPFYLRGTNVALHRFFEDRARDELPWQDQWIYELHKVFKDMYWNSYRLHVGFAPERWYEIADQEGFLIQDEYPLWGCWSDEEKKRHKAGVLAAEYKKWIKERWNHPSVVIWDAQNETKWKATGKAISRVRSLDRSGRPWDNGYSPPQSRIDVVESHPYLFNFENQGTFAIDPPWEEDSLKNRQDFPSEGWLKNEFSVEPEPFNDVNQYFPPSNKDSYPNPIIVNEYGWIWLYRNGQPAWAAEEVWEYYPEYDTRAVRWQWRGRVIAAMTEYWRSKRDLAGVQHFCALTCNRSEKPKSMVSDEWQNVERLIMQPGFKKYVKPAFAPVGLMIKKWDKEYDPGQKINVPVTIINDLYQSWEGKVTLKIKRGQGILTTKSSKKIYLKKLGKTELNFSVELPERIGDYKMLAEIQYKKERVFSTRLFSIR